jgi:hypothetical protein
MAGGAGADLIQDPAGPVGGARIVRHDAIGELLGRARLAARQREPAALDTRRDARRPTNISSRNTASNAPTSSFARPGAKERHAE